MEKNKKIERAEYVKERIDKVKNKPKEMKRIADELFISYRTVRRDYES